MAQAPQTEELPGDNYVTKYKKLPNGSAKFEMEDVKDAELANLLKYRDKAFEYGDEGYWWNRQPADKREKWGDCGFRNTHEQHEEWKANYKKPAQQQQQTTLTPPPKTLPPASLQPQSADLGGGPVQLLPFDTEKIPVPIGWKAVDLLKIDNIWHVAMKRVS